MQQLAIKTNITLNDLTIKSAIVDLTKVTQEAKTLNANTSVTYTGITKVFYLKASSPVNVTITKGTNNITLVVNDTLILTDAITSILVANPIGAAVVEALVIYG